MRLAVAALISVVVVWASCAGAPPCPKSPRSANADPRPFLWEVSGERGKLILFGTFHGAGKDHIPKLAIEKLRAAKIFVGEIPPGRLPPSRGEDLEVALGPKSWAELRDAVARIMSAKELRHAPPWMAMSALTAASIDAPEVPMDAALVDIARRRELPSTFLETADEQSRSLTTGVTIDDLKQAIADRRHMRCRVHDLVAAYRDGDWAPIRESLADGAEATLLVERNRRWVRTLEDLLPDGAFVAVGVSHLVGEASVPALLEEKGYQVTRLGP